MCEHCQTLKLHNYNAYAIHLQCASEFNEMHSSQYGKTPIKIILKNKSPVEHSTHILDITRVVCGDLRQCRLIFLSILRDFLAAFGHAFRHFFHLKRRLNIYYMIGSFIFGKMLFYAFI